MKSSDHQSHASRTGIKCHDAGSTGRTQGRRIENPRLTIAPVAVIDAQKMNGTVIRNPKM
jgi:hypothetical protein